MCARCLSCSVRSLSKIEFQNPPEKRAKKCYRGYSPGRFPKASAKVRQLSEPAKFFGNFLQGKTQKGRDWTK
jgi:hypothetical protein